MKRSLLDCFPFLSITLMSGACMCCIGALQSEEEIVSAQDSEEEYLAKNYPIIDPCGKCAQLGPTGGPDHMITPNAGPCVFNGADLGITADFIYWAFRPEGTEFLHLSEFVEGADVPFSLKGKRYDLNPSMSPGFKIGLSLIFDHDGWDADALYTWLQPTYKKKVTSSNQQSLIAGEFFPIEYETILEHSPISSADLHFCHQFNVIDFTLGRNFFISRFLKLRPFIGLKGSWQQEDIHGTAYYTKIGATDQFLVFSKEASHFWGVGVLSGIDMGWMATRNISILGDIGVTGMWMSFKNHLLGYNNNITKQIYNTVNNVEIKTHGVFPIIETSLGMSWEDWFRCEEFHYSIAALWELQWWANRTDVVYPKGMGMQGLTLQFRFDF